jgi:hypothetical protein
MWWINEQSRLLAGPMGEGKTGVRVGRAGKPVGEWWTSARLQKDQIGEIHRNIYKINVKTEELE